MFAFLVSQTLYTWVAHKCLSANVYQVVPSEDIDINHSVALWNIHAQTAVELPSYNVVQLVSGTTGVFFIGRTDFASHKYEAAAILTCPSSLYTMWFPFSASKKPHQIQFKLYAPFERDNRQVIGSFIYSVQLSQLEFRAHIVSQASNTL